MTAGGWAAYPAAVVAAYLLGAIPFGFVIVRLLKGIDIRTVGSGNIGATNVARAAGAKAGIAAFALDVAKGYLAATLVPLVAYVIARPGALDGEGFVHAMVAGAGFTDLRMLCGLAAICGHVWTVFLGFKGGKGVATSLGVCLGLTPLPTFAALSVWAAVTGISRYVSLGSVVAAVSFPAAYALLAGRRVADDWRLFAFTAIVAIIVVVRHRENLKRLAAGTESRIRSKDSKPS